MWAFCSICTRTVTAATAKSAAPSLGAPPRPSLEPWAAVVGDAQLHGTCVRTCQGSAAFERFLSSWRVAAMSVAKRVSEEVGCPLGTTV
eukprot:577258-Rhodomonas_salina.1